MTWRSRDSRAEHLIALVHDGATLKDAASAYGISSEHVRQILREGGMTARDLPGRAEMRRSRRFAPSCELAPVIEAMWRKGMLCHEIAAVLDVSGEAAHRLIGERVPAEEREAQARARAADPRPDEERLLRGVRVAAHVVADTPGLDPAHRRRAQARIDGWLTAHAQLTPSESPPAVRTDLPACPSPARSFTAADLARELERFRLALRAGGLRESTINAYLDRSARFVRWLAGDYAPRARAR